MSEKLKEDICYCKKNYYDNNSEILFKQGEFYSFYIEDIDKYIPFETAWVTYKPNVNVNRGRRFHLNRGEMDKISSMSPYYMYFENLRKLKLNKLNQINGNS